jgi:hypothetical protein
MPELCTVMKRKRKLDYLLIPASSRKAKKERERAAIDEAVKRKIKQVVILDGRDSEEDIFYLGKVVKKGQRIGFDTFPSHYKEYKELIRRAKKYGEFPRGVKIENIKTPESFREHIYGFLGWEEERLKKRKLKPKRYRNENGLEFLKGIIKKIIKIN